MLTAINCQEPDHVPLWNLWSEHTGPGCTWKDQIQRAEALIERGLDDTLALWVDHWHRTSLDAVLAQSGVKVSFTRQVSPDQPYPLLTKTYDTPAGTLRRAVKQTEDWPHGEDVPLMSNCGMARAVEHLVKGPEDLDKLKYLFPPLSADEMRQFREEARATKAAAQRLGVMVEGGWIGGGDLAILLCGVEPLVTAAIDDPAYVQALFQFLYEQQVPRIELLLEEGVDTVVQEAWYDTTDFWSPRLYRQHLKPFIQKQVDLVHSAGAKYTYYMSCGIMPLLDDFVEMGIDSFWGVDPVQGDADLRVVKEKLGGKVCIWGGMNSTLTLQYGSREEIREAVDTAIRTLGPGGGFVLMPVDQIFAYTPWENFEVMVERWREIGSYPIRG